MGREFRLAKDGTFVGLTGVNPKGFEGSIFIGYTGTPDNLSEEAIPVGKLPTTVVSEEDIPPEWKEAFKQHGFEFEEDEEVAASTGLAGEIEQMKQMVELEKLAMQLAEMRCVVTPDYTTRTVIPFWHFALCGACGFYCFCGLLGWFVI